MKRNGLTVTINQLRELADELEGDLMSKNTKFQVNIINKTGLSDDWELEI